MFEALRQGLLQSYKPKIITNVRCAICGAADKPISLHVLEYYHDSLLAAPSEFVPMSKSGGTSRGSVPICVSCAAPCGKCGLPVVTPWHRKIGDFLQSRTNGVTLRAGQGYCRHVHPLADLLSLFKPVRTSIAPAASSPTRDSVKRVMDVLAEIDRAQLIPGFELVKDGIQEQLKDRVRTQVSIEEDGLSPDGLIYLLASNVANAQLCSGSHHIYRGVLSMSGRQLLAAYEKASEMMVQCDIHSQDEHDRDMQSIEKEISEIG